MLHPSSFLPDHVKCVAATYTPYELQFASLRLAPAFILVQKAYYDTLIELRGRLTCRWTCGKV